MLASRGFHASEVRVGHTLQCVDPSHHRQRLANSYCQLNPAIYRADYFGEKLHIDQNEKLVMFSVTHVAAIDGFSGKIVAFETMPIKNNTNIYTSKPLRLENYECCV